MTHNKIVDIVHVSFIHILLPQLLMYSLVNVILLEIDHLCVRLGMLDTRVRDDCWYLWVGGGFWCLSHYFWLTSIAIGRPKILFQILHCTGKLIRGY